MAFDYRCPYLKCPAGPSEAFPDAKHSWLPFLEVVLVSDATSFRTLALLDTGSSYTLMRSDFAEALGIDWRAAPKAPVIGISSRIEAHFTTMKMAIAGTRVSWRPVVGFSDQLAIKTPLLGHRGFFEFFDVRFKTAQRKYRIRGN